MTLPSFSGWVTPWGLLQCHVIQKTAGALCRPRKIRSYLVACVYRRFYEALEDVELSSRLGQGESR
jgi:hypothetical protein